MNDAFFADNSDFNGDFGTYIKIKLVQRDLSIWPISIPEAKIDVTDNLPMVQIGVPTLINVPVSIYSIVGTSRPEDLNIQVPVTLQAGSQTLIQNISISTLLANQNYVVVPFMVTFQPEDAGLKTLIATVNAGNVVKETDYFNNESQQSVHVVDGYKLNVSIFRHFQFDANEDQNLCTPEAMKLKDTSVCQTGEIKEGSVLDIPFGGHFQFALTDSNSEPIPATYELVPGTYEEPQDPLDPTKKISVEAASLYKDKVAILFTQDPEKKKQNLVSVHMGAQKLKITPLGTNKPITITLNSVAPHASNDSTKWLIIGHDAAKVKELNTALDTAENKLRFYFFDKLIITYAHKFGIPPQYIKAKLIQESRLRPNSYRYEPAFDKTYIRKDLLKVNFKQSYTDYLFFSLPPILTSPALHLRSKYKVLINNEYVYVPDDYETTVVPNQYTPLKAKSLVNYINNETIPIKENWYTSDEETGSIDYVKIQNTLNFTAQTIVSSSYGLSQIMLTTAYKMGYKEPDAYGIKRIKNPMDLFKPEVCIALGTSYLAKMYIDINNLDINNTNFTGNMETYNQYTRNALAAYNGGPGKYMKDVPQGYQESTISWVRYYKMLVKLNSPIFE